MRKLIAYLTGGRPMERVVYCCNGLRTLSVGDCETYRKTVNSPKHAQDFFYALLITHGTPNDQMRYAMKHFIFVWHSNDFVEVPQSNVRTDGKILGQ